MGVMTFTRGPGAGGAWLEGETAEDTYKKYRVVRGTLLWSASYATGGDDIPMASVGLGELWRILVDPAGGGLLSVGGYNAVMPGAVPLKAPKLQLFINAAEAANASNQSAKGVNVWLLGI